MRKGMIIIKKAYTDPIIIRPGAAADMTDWLASRFGDGAGLVVCDTNTYRHAPPSPDKLVFGSDVTATDIRAGEIATAISERRPAYLVACGAGTVHDLTRYAANEAGLPFISFPTAASVDGFVSNVAAMTVDGRKVTYPSTAPAALFADADIYGAAPAALTASGVGDIVGKYISLFDWKAAHIITGEPIDADIYALEEDAVMRVMESDIKSADYTEKVMECLVMSGMAIQYMGNSRPASGAEHHLSHLWEMHCINPPTDALHGEKVGVSTLLVLEEYKRLAREGIEYRRTGGYFSHSRLNPVFGELTEGIISENTPDPFDGITAGHIAAVQASLVGLIGTLPDTCYIRDYLRSCGAKTTLTEIGLPDTGEFINMSLRYAPYVRRRMTLLKLSAAR
ncbi:MAG: sn-glycerol-1-phosphate dehydrogenase [Eubacteriales bacterium]|jgi:glycerol-1-phosphate dehydrogenase [NAD(P)+]|nr:sn-glycerol-1-phosphate dehydrogenase [Eubacteriales bacterium]